jgi:hypothetical protein
MYVNFDLDINVPHVCHDRVTLADSIERFDYWWVSLYANLDSLYYRLWLWEWN